MPTYYIAPPTHPTTPGNDTTGNGSSSTPWATFAKFLSSSIAGDTCVAKNGTYTWATATVTSRTLQKDSESSTVIFDGAGAGVSVSAPGSTFNGLRFTNFTNINSSTPLFRIGDYSFINCIFDNLTIDSQGGVFGGLVGGFNPPETLTANRTITFTNCMLRANLKTAGSSGYLFPIRMADTRTVTFVITNTTFSFLAATNRIEYLFVDSPFDTGNCAVQMSYSVIYNATGAAINFDLSSSFVSGGVTSQKNIYYNVSRQPSGTGDKTSDPLFIDPAGGNFNLQIGSPARVI